MIKKCFSSLAIILLPMLMNPVKAEEQENVNPQFIKLLTYEIQNRAFALDSISNAVNARAGEPDEKVWSAYLSLEQLNLRKYKHVADKYAISQNATFLTNIKTWLGGVLSMLFPETALKGIRDATIVYVKQLEELEALADSEDKSFFHYVVLQEKAQAQALTLFAEGEVEQAAAVMESFVVKYDE